MTAATSSSDRYAEARAALKEYESWELPAVVRLREALRALITPPATDETPHLPTVYRKAHDRALPNENGPFTGADLKEANRAGLEAVYQAGIQAAWESWEPENAPGHGQSWEYGARYTDSPESAPVHVLRPDTTADEAREFAISRTRKSGATHIVGRIVTEWETIAAEDARAQRFERFEERRRLDNDMPDSLTHRDDAARYGAAHNNSKGD